MRSRPPAMSRTRTVDVRPLATYRTDTTVDAEAVRAVSSAGRTRIRPLSVPAIHRWTPISAIHPRSSRSAGSARPPAAEAPGAAAVPGDPPPLTSDAAGPPAVVEDSRPVRGRPPVRPATSATTSTAAPRSSSENGAPLRRAEGCQNMARHLSGGRPWRVQWAASRAAPAGGTSRFGRPRPAPPTSRARPCRRPEWSRYQSSLHRHVSATHLAHTSHVRPRRAVAPGHGHVSFPWRPRPRSTNGKGSWSRA